MSLQTPDLRTSRDRLQRWRVLAWCLFDFANSAFTTVVVTSIYAVYFVRTVVPPGRISGELLWSIGLSTSLILSAALSPILGALADERGLKRPLLITSSLVCIVATALLVTVGRGDWIAGITLFVLANVGFEVGYVFYNAFLNDVAPPGRAGQISGLGWATGYIGGMVSLVVALFPTKFLLPEGSTPEQMEAGARTSFLLVAAHFLLFALPAFFLLRDRIRPVSSEPLNLWQPFRRLVSTIRNRGRHAEAFKFILANLVYNDGVVTVFFFAGIYMDRVLHFSQSEIILAVLLINIPSALGSVVFGFLSDRIGGKTSILITLAILIVTIMGITGTSPGAWPFGLDLEHARTAFWILSMTAGLAIGANQSASRGLMSQLVPEDQQGEFFGFFIFSGKLSSVLAPLTYGLVTQVTGSSVLALLSVGLFLAAGGALLLLVDERGGIQAARDHSDSSFEPGIFAP